MFGLFGRNNCCENESSTILWFIILVILLFMNNGNDCTPDCGRNECGCQNMQYGGQIKWANVVIRETAAVRRQTAVITAAAEHGYG